MERREYFVPLQQMIPSDEARDFFRVLGTLIAIHIIVLNTCPDPFSPFVLHAILSQGLSLASDRNGWLIAELEPESKRALEPWMSLSPDDTISGNNHDLITLLVDMDIFVISLFPN